MPMDSNFLLNYETDVKTLSFYIEPANVQRTKIGPALLNYYRMSKYTWKKISPTLFIKGHGNWVGLKLAPIFLKIELLWTF